MSDIDRRRADAVRLLASLLSKPADPPDDRGPGRPRDEAILVRDLTVFLRLAELRSSGSKKLGAIKQVRDEYGLSESVVEEIYKRWLSGSTFPSVAGKYSVTAPKFGRRRRRGATPS